MINQFVTLVTPAAPIEPLHSTLGLTPNFLQWFSTAVVEDECVCLPICKIPILIDGV